MDDDTTNSFLMALLGGITTLGIVSIVVLILLSASGCRAYKGGTVVDGTNLAVGMKLPGTEWAINVIDYVGGIRVGGNDQTRMTVTNEVCETNRYFGVIETSRHTRLYAEIAPCEVVDGRAEQEKETDLKR